MVTPMETPKERLLADRLDLLQRLAETPADRMLEPGHLRLLADVQTAIAAVEAATVETNRSPST